MRLGRIIFSLVVALAMTISFLSYAGFAQEGRTKKVASSDGMANDANRVAVTKEQGINPQYPVQPVQTVTEPLPAITISFLPADIFGSAIKPRGIETAYPARLLELTASKGPGQSNDNYDPATLAKKLRNPVSLLARVSFRNSIDFALASDREGWRYTMNLEPIIPIALNKDWNLISRTNMPFIQQDGIVASTVQSGLGDILQSVFISPSKTEPFFWGAGTALLIPTATDTRLGAGKFGLGPAMVVGKQQHGWTYGALAHQIWSVAGHRDRADVRSTFIQPFVAYTTKSAWTYSLDTESIYDWIGKQWSVPIHFEVTKVVRFGWQPVSVGAALRCWGATPPGGPQACGVRFVVTPVFPAR